MSNTSLICQPAEQVCVEKTQQELRKSYSLPFLASIVVAVLTLSWLAIDPNGPILATVLLVQFGIVLILAIEAVDENLDSNKDFEASRQLLLEIPLEERESLVYTHQEAVAHRVYASQAEGNEAAEEKNRKAFEDFASQVKTANIGVIPFPLYHWLHLSEAQNDNKQ